MRRHSPCKGWTTPSRVALALQQAGINLTPAFAADLAASRSWRTGHTAADIYAEFAQSVSALV